MATKRDSYNIGFAAGNKAGGTNNFKPGARKNEAYREYVAGFDAGTAKYHEDTKVLRQELAELNKPRALRKNPAEIHIDVNSHNAKGGKGVKTNPAKKKPVKQNPVLRPLYSRPKPANRLDKKVFTVESKSGQRWKVEGIFPTEEKAREYAHALDAQSGHTMTIRVTV